MKPSEYFWKATLIAFLIPAAIATLPFLLLACITPAVMFAVPALLVFGFFGPWAWKQSKRFVENAKTGLISTSFLVLYLPFFLPIFYTLVFATIELTVYPAISQGEGLLTVFIMFPQFIGIWFIYFLVMMMGRFRGVFFLFPLGTYSIAAVVFSGAVWYFSPVVTKNRVTGISIIAALLAVFSGLAVVQYNAIWDRLLLLDRSVVTIPEEISERDSPRDEIDLTDYRPFTGKRLVQAEVGDFSIAENYPVLDGAFAMYPLYSAYAQAAYKDYPLEKAEYAVLVGTTPEAFERLLSGQSDMVFMGQPSQAQLQQAEASGRTLRIVPIAKEAFVFFVNRSNPVDDLTVQQIRDIYMKRTANWREVGGKNSKILPFQRPEGSGSQNTMLKVMQGETLPEPLQGEFQRSMGGIVNRVADYRNYHNSIGYSFRYFVTSMFQNDGIKILAVEGIRPTPQTIRDETYPFVSEVCIPVPV